MTVILYIHGKGGSAAEAEHYKAIFPGVAVIGLDYKTCSPWETGREITDCVKKLKRQYDDVVLVANSIGAFFSMNGELDGLVNKAYFISPIVDMEKLIVDMMTMANVTEAELQARGTISTEFGEDLSWEYLIYVRNHPINWNVPTRILYGSEDKLTSLATMEKFAEVHNAQLTVMEKGEHWFHTEEQIEFLDNWILTN